MENLAQVLGLMTLIDSTGDIVSLLIRISVAVALLVFFWGLAKFVVKAGDEVEEGKRIMKWGILALFVMISVWGIVGFFQKELGLPDTTVPEPTDAPNINPFAPKPNVGDA